MRTLVLVPDGVGIRNFLCTNFIELLLPSGPVEIWHGVGTETLRPFVERYGTQVRWEPFPLAREAPFCRLLRQAKLQAQLRSQRDPALARHAGYQPRVPWSLGRLVTWASKTLGAAFDTPSGVARLHRWHGWCAARSEAALQARARWTGQRPEVVFCTHQRASLAVATMAAARRERIPTATFIYSWDNPPKGRMAVPADHLMVWSEWMRHEMEMYFPEFPQDRVHVVGTPQFEHYFDGRLLQSREQFMGALGLDPRRRLVCFSGDDITTSPHDPQYLADVARAARAFPEATRPAVVFRRCPVDTSGRFNLVLKEYPEICVSDPLWHTNDSGDWTQIVPTIADVGLLANLASHTDVMINLGSTMAMDAAIFGKPSIYVAYEAPGATDHNVETVYRLPHFEWVHKLQPVYWARTAEELGPLIARALDHPEEKEAARQAWIDKIVARPLDAASRRCAETLRRIASAVPGRG